MRSARWVKFYVSHGSEVETEGMIALALAHGKRVAVPKVEGGGRLLLSKKLPFLVHDYRYLIQKMSPILIDDPSKKAVIKAAQVIHHKDAPILAAAIDGDMDYLITWNTKHFHQQSVMRTVRFKIVTPSEFLREFRRSLSHP